MFYKMLITIYNRLKLVYIKKRVFPIFLIIQNIIIALIVLIYANLIISNGKTMGELNYQQIKTFYAITIFLLFILPTLYSPYFLSKSVNELVKNNITVNLFSSKTKSTHIIYSSYLCGFFATFVLTISILPIVIVSFYFGGVSINRLLIILIYLLFYIIIISIISLAISARVEEPNLSIVLAYIVNIFLLIIHMFMFNYVINNYLLLLFYSFVVILLFLILLVFSQKTRIFSINL